MFKCSKRKTIQVINDLRKFASEIPLDTPFDKNNPKSEYHPKPIEWMNWLLNKFEKEKNGK